MGRCIVYSIYEHYISLNIYICNDYVRGHVKDVGISNMAKKGFLKDKKGKT